MNAIPGGPMLAYPDRMAMGPGTSTDMNPAFHLLKEAAAAAGCGRLLTPAANSSTRSTQ